MVTSGGGGWWSLVDAGVGGRYWLSRTAAVSDYGGWWSLVDVGDGGC